MKERIVMKPVQIHTHNGYIPTQTYEALAFLVSKPIININNSE